MFISACQGGQLHQDFELMIGRSISPLWSLSWRYVTLTLLTVIDNGNLAETSTQILEYGLMEDECVCGPGVWAVGILGIASGRDGGLPLPRVADGGRMGHLPRGRVPGRSDNRLGGYPPDGNRVDGQDHRCCSPRSPLEAPPSTATSTNAASVFSSNYFVTS